MKDISKLKQNNQYGFSLVEVLVALSLILITFSSLIKVQVNAVIASSAAKEIIKQNLDNANQLELIWATTNEKQSWV
ncbi:prepilin-type N-terminal cleavage/methylation domain-containing protein [Thiotrichales bacterium 19S11-10]|nr:prepilin-type N-terminal cleavage/methylation domain-containing protein [Thiotrichales bacterium 19S11-10]MCF6807196.1 prepilin-type N-terminal cleavage/methylation domain-containing protein [Thiotrichales bacterium 19S9-11]